ncbi:MAG: hypothetical protein K0S41_2319 [Anaerocolumna sp.]|jgi:hypothetical protein|nr:hypothetical protein [Anaerocolumna sp.]
MKIRIQHVSKYIVLSVFILVDYNVSIAVFN